MLVCKQWQEVNLFIIPIGHVKVIFFLTILNNQAGHRLWAEFPLHLDGQKIISFSGIKRLSKPD